jgi:hypothetical protein
MSITAVSSIGIMQAPDNSAKVQLERDQRKLVADTEAGAAEPALAAGQVAITPEREDVNSSGSSVDTYL